MCDIVTGVFDLAVRMTHRRDFWRKPVDQEEFRSRVAQCLVANDVEIGLVTPLADQLVEVIAHWHADIPPPDDRAPVAGPWASGGKLGPWTVRRPSRSSRSVISTYRCG